MNNEAQLLVIGNNSRLYKNFGDLFPSHISCSHADQYIDLIKKNNVVKVVLLSHSSNIAENEKLLNDLYVNDVEICYVSTSAVCNTRNMRFKYPRGKRHSEIFINTYFLKYAILRFGLIEGLHDLKYFTGSVPYSTQATLIEHVNRFADGKLEGFYDCFEKITIEGTKSNSLIYRNYKYIARLPVFVSRPLDYFLRRLGYRNYGYVYEQ